MALVHARRPERSRALPPLDATPARGDRLFEGAAAVPVLLAAPLGVGCALFIAEYAPLRLRGPVSCAVELLAAIPSIIYGLWGFFVLAPVMRSAVEPFLKTSLGPLPVVGALFSGPAVGRDLLVAGVILAIMILPTITAVSREILRAVPDTQREGMLA